MEEQQGRKEGSQLGSFPFVTNHMIDFPIRLVSFSLVRVSNLGS